LYVKFERLIAAPVEVMGEIWDWLGLPRAAFDPENLIAQAPESDSHYRYKFPHRTYNAIQPAKEHWVPPRIVQGLRGQYEWYYRVFYPEVAKT
jgi:sulfotransferase